MIIKREKKSMFDLQLIYWWFWPRQSQMPGYKDMDDFQRAGQQTFCISSSPKLWLNQYVRLERGHWFPARQGRRKRQLISVEIDRGAAQVQKTVTQTKASLTMLLFWTEIKLYSPEYFCTRRTAKRLLMHYTYTLNWSYRKCKPLLIPHITIAKMLTKALHHKTGGPFVYCLSVICYVVLLKSHVYITYFSTDIH